MKIITKLLLFACATLTLSLSAQIIEHTYDGPPGGNDSGWKIVSQPMTGYVITGNKFFQANNTNITMLKFAEKGGQEWVRTHATGFSQVNTFWKSWTKSGNPLGYFVVTSGTKGGQHQYFAMTTNNTGMKVYEGSGPLDNGIQFGGACQATNGGFIAVGSNNSGNAIAAKFTVQGALLWIKTFSPGFAWCVQQTLDGNYVMAGSMHIWKFDTYGNQISQANINLPLSPDGSAYSYGEFEEILVYKDGTGFLVTGSAFSNQYSAPYIARFSNSLGAQGSSAPDATNTALPGTPVAWINNAVHYGSNNQAVVSWRKGPVSTGGVLRGTITSSSGSPGSVGNLGGSVLVQEAFMVKDHGNRYVIGGTAGGYNGWFSWISTAINVAPPPVAPTEGENLANQSVPPPTEQVWVRNSVPNKNVLPNFLPKDDINPTPISRRFYVDLNIFPNPASGTVFVGGPMEEGSMVQLFSTNGRLVSERAAKSGEKLLEFDIAALQAGVYFVKMTDARGTVSKKVVVE